jgi:hypothetical protein
MDYSQVDSSATAAAARPSTSTHVWRSIFTATGCNDGILSLS